MALSTFFRAQRSAQGPSQALYKEAAKEVRKFHDFSFNLRGNLSPNQKRAITVQAEKLRGFVDEIEESKKTPGIGQQTKFVKFKSRAEKKRALETLGRDVVTNKGFLLKTPSARGRKSSASITEDFIRIVTGGETRLLFHIEDPIEFAFDPAFEIGKKISDHGIPQAISFTFNGYAMTESKQFEEIEDFFNEYQGNDGFMQALNGFMLIYFDE